MPELEPEGEGEEREGEQLQQEEREGLGYRHGRNETREARTQRTTELEQNLRIFRMETRN